MRSWFFVFCRQAFHVLALVSVRKHIESLESVVIQEWWPDSRRVTDADGTEQSKAAWAWSSGREAPVYLF